MARGRKKRQRNRVTPKSKAASSVNAAPQEAQAVSSTHATPPSPPETKVASDSEANLDELLRGMKFGENIGLGGEKASSSSVVKKKRGRKSKAEKEALKLLALAENNPRDDNANLVDKETENGKDGVFKKTRGRKRKIDKDIVLVSPNTRASRNREVTIEIETETETGTELQQKEKEEPLAVLVKDTSDGKIVTRKLQANQIWYLGKTEKVMVELNGNGQGHDNGSNLLVRFLGKLAKNSKICPLSVERWNLMPEDNSLQQWNYVADNFEFDYAAGIKWVMSTLGERWKAYKYRLRCKYFHPNRGKEDILAYPPSGVDSDDWTAFVNYYKDNDKIKIRSLQNKLNRKKLKISHAGGSKSNARRGHEMELELGRAVCRSEVILSTLQKKDGNYVNEEGKTLADKISENLSQDQERAANSGVSSKVLAYPDDAIGKVYGVEHSGRVRGFGAGVCPSSVFENMPRRSIEIVKFGSFKEESVDDLKKHVETLEVKLAGFEETREQLLQTQNQLATLHKFLQDKFGSELPTINHDVPSS